MAIELVMLLGGVGLFLLGMVLLTQSLRNLAGARLRRWMSEYTRTPLRGAAAGAVMTAILRSSSATTVTAVGFVGAGLITFSQGFGIVLGANVGTTVTGWIVAILGFKLDMGLAAMPLLFVGVMMRLVGNVRLQQIGLAIAGFSLLFVGLEVMKQGIGHMSDVVTPDVFPEDTFPGRLQLLLIGVLITLVTQSSSAGVASALVALAGGAISFPQAAAMVIGMDVGTTATAALASFGGTTAMRQTGYGHVIFNVLSAVLALMLLDPYFVFVNEYVASGGGPGNAQIALVGFHTTFNVLSVVIALPFVGALERLIVRLVPEHGPPLLGRLDDRLLREPSAAVDAAVATLRDIAALQYSILAELLDPAKRQYPDRAMVAAVDEAIEATRGFMNRITISPVDQRSYRRYQASMHALDHLIRLANRCAQETRIGTLATEHRLRRLSRIFCAALNSIELNAETTLALARMERVKNIMAAQVTPYRARMLGQAAEHEHTAYVTLSRLDAMRWLDRTSDHVWRILHHLALAEQQVPETPGPREPEVVIDGA